MQTEPKTTHRWLQQFVGAWIYQSECAMELGKPPETFQGQEQVRMLGELWLLCEGSGQIPGGGQANTLLTLGYDSQRQRYVGSWVGSMMEHLWVYDGELNATETELTLYTTGPGCSGTGSFRYRDVIRIVDANTRQLNSYIEDADGAWSQLMTTTYRRQG